jgi:hypothetical protein
MIRIRFCAAVSAMTFLSTACISKPVQSDHDYLSEDEIVDLMQHPKKWDGRTLKIKTFPYDNGFKASYVVCFERCDESYSQSSPFIILTSENRFAGYKGDRPVIVHATYSSACFYTKAVCADSRFGEFTEIP